MPLHTITYLSLFLISIPIIGLVFNRLSYKTSSIFISIGLTLSLLLLTHTYPYKTPLYFFGLKADGLGFLMTALIFFVSTVVHQFSIRYMAGDRNYSAYFDKLSLITFSATVMALADNLLLFFAAWCLNNTLLILLMVHKQKWNAAKYSGKLASKTLITGAVLFISAIFLMLFETGSLSIDQITQHTSSSPIMICALCLCIITAMTQSALWPFHRWLISSLNSPTPVSAIMHAGLVNGGGFLLVRFAPLLSEQPLLLDLIFFVGILSAILGTLWKLVQSDVKRMLACSTMGQMGFMMVQCGLGIFPAAITHLIWHGLFKAFLFLSAGSAVQSLKADDHDQKSTLSAFIISCVYGLIGAYSFAWFSEQPFFSMNTTTFLIGFAFISATQVANTILKNNMSFFRNVLAIIVSGCSGILYGYSIFLIESLIPSLKVHPHAISALHLTGFFGFVIIWLVLNLESLKTLHKTIFWKRTYVALLNSSQPHPKTITAIRQSYHY